MQARSRVPRPCAEGEPEQERTATPALIAALAAAAGVALAGCGGGGVTTQRAALSTPEPLALPSVPNEERERQKERDSAEREVREEEHAEEREFGKATREERHETAQGEPGKRREEPAHQAQGGEQLEHQVSFTGTRRVRFDQQFEAAAGVPSPCRTWRGGGVMGLLCDASRFGSSPVEIHEEPGGVSMDGPTVRHSSGTLWVSQALGGPLRPGDFLRLRALGVASGTLIVEGLSTRGNTNDRSILKADDLLARFDRIQLQLGQTATVRFEGTGEQPRFVYEGPSETRPADAQVAINVRNELETQGG